ncbi:hypothetical protein MGYG_02127 [Nannizzia gypsea CBS 118893]|uniref:Uncharacterized protein n=1 Tax=Arthroderma gypseum (strain ATCC MYA-4604 / CBS 118893) TaxID=535722 RepID=E4UPY0_ARTGP|nr:hypothetical protein MGYG_02127 [Nannizzia gypsea CBS 118893]EFQ99114.1 hypothetical protein MGYG_02127 [Nannizzia gypsea CBS 118893]
MADQRRHGKSRFSVSRLSNDIFCKRLLRYIGGATTGDAYAERFPIYFKGARVNLYLYSKAQTELIFENKDLGNTLYMELYGTTRRLWAYSRFIYSFIAMVAILGGYIFTGAY